ncbi:anaerobic glycerol-3-phosphate dehydrogenase subunit C [Lacipirellula sp.]|uniref:anaerobic glycerol-3-phosphate dehydrogenase subunit C n=1 Tax=Lacipirellula sp. TaxID=2691419 RepID=UPI003D0D713A
MDAEQLRIRDDLRGQLDGDVHCDDLFVQMYASDASIFEVPPLGVALPRHRDDVVAIVRYAAERGIPLFPRGAGTGLAGDSLGRGIVVDFSKHMRRIVSVGEDHVVVQPGVVLAQLNDRLARSGRMFGPDPANVEVTTMGSVVALDASGSRWPAYGSTRRHVRELEVVLADGQVTRLSQHVPDVDAERRDDPAGALAAGVADIIARHQHAIDERRTRSLVDRSGYRLHDLWKSNDADERGTIDLARLLVGSEGTLAIVTEATLATVALPEHTGSMLLFFTSLSGAAQAAAELSMHTLRACDLMDRRHLSLARESNPRYEFLIPAEAEAVLLVECGGESEEEVRQALREIEHLLVDQRRMASSSQLALDPFDSDILWQLARRYVPTLYRLRGSSRPVPFVEDIAVPPQALPNFLQKALETLRRHQVTASIFGHAAHGQLHIRPFIDLTDPQEVPKLRELAEELYGYTWEVGGTISGEHAEGYSRTPYAAGQHGPLMAAFREVKLLFDPRGILNPGKKIPADSVPLETPLRRVTFPLLDRLEVDDAPPQSSSLKRPPSSLIQLQLDWRPDEMTYAARMCNGCGACRTQEAESRMCPTFRPAPREEASPRAKANLARAILTGALPAGAVLEEAVKEVCDLCIHCHMCRLECPANVDVPKLMAEAKGSYVAVNGLRLHDWFITNIDVLCGYASRFPNIANWAIRSRWARWVIERTLGIAQGRKLPRFTRGPFLESSTQARLAKPNRDPGEKVLLFVDTFANFCDSQLAKAFVAVLEHNDVSVYIPDRQYEAGMPMISQGALGPARLLAERNVAMLSEAVRQGYTIVSTEPSAILALQREYAHLLGDDSDVRLVAENSMEATQYLWRLHQKGRLRLDFQPLEMTVGYHTPCHVKALEVGVPSVNLMGLIPKLDLRLIEKGCSGAAGLFGFQKKNYRTSLRIGLPLITELRKGGYRLGVTECSTCRIQMEQGASMATLHPVKLVALAYGLMPELRQLIDSPAQELVVR